MAGTVWWDGELFTADRIGEKLMSAKSPGLTAEEQAFLDGLARNCARLLRTGHHHTQGDMSPQCVGG